MHVKIAAAKNPFSLVVNVDNRWMFQSPPNSELYWR